MKHNHDAINRVLLLKLMAIHLKTIRGSKFTQILYGMSPQEMFCRIRISSGTKISLKLLIVINCYYFPTILTGVRVKPVNQSQGI